MRLQLGDTFLVDAKSVGHLVQPFEQHFDYTIVLDEQGADLRQCERFSATRYVIHSERFDIPVPVTALTPMLEQAFIDAFKRARALDWPDVRKAVRLALKALTPQQVPVV